AAVYMDADREAIAAWPETDLEDGPGPQSLAYVMYTSGSTGAPKGVMIEHGGVCNRLKWGVEFYGLNETDRVLQKASFAFDASVWEIFEPLIAGAQIVMAKPRGRIDVEYLADLMAAQQVTVAEFSPSLLRALLENEKLARCRALKRVFSGGEVLPPDVVRACSAQSRAELYNTYGPTETSIDVTHWKCGGESADNVPIGRPVAGMCVYILDERMEPVPPGMPGELCIGGIGVARGYLNAPELTADRFVADPFSGVPGARLYKSGDLARHRRDGAIEFLGRKDQQVKIRGFRIEPGEIEAALRSHPAIRQAAVVPRENGRGDSRLAAYLVAADRAPPADQDLRRFLRERLPDYMVPRAFVFLDSIPLTQSGKVDRRALPSPNGDSRPAAPKIETVESRVTEIWESVLSVQPIGADDNFFDIGGDSLTAVELMRRTEQAFGERIALSTFLGGPTIKDMAAALVRQRIAPDRSLLVKVQPGDGKPPFFFLHGDFFNGGGFYTINMARYIGADRPFYALAPHGLNGTAVPPTVEAMADDYIEMLRAVQPHGPYYVGGFCSGGSVAYEIARRLESQGEGVALVVLIAIPARTAFYHRALRAIGGAGSVIGLDAKQRVNVFLRARNMGLRLRRLYRSVRAAQPSPRINRTPPRHMPSRNDPIFGAYGRALSAYVPKRYPGRVLCLWPEQDKINGRDATAGWGRVACALQFQLIPGEHGNCVKYHLKTIAEHMRRAILQAEDGASPEHS
ncbi:MAG TPA: amino acid adenylation domain-containing protein, partial [Candidatus Binatia bacterium]